MTSSPDPFAVLGVSIDADERTIRRAYLDLVKQHPPERDADKFRDIQAAYHAALDPLVVARQIAAGPNDEPPQWSDALEQARTILPRFSPTVLLSFGDRAAADSEIIEE